MSSNINIGNTPVNQGYVQLIHTGETGGIDGTLRTLYDGDGTASDLQIASNKVKVSTELYIGSKTATEFIQDIVGDMFTTGSYTNITTTYDDTNGNIDLSASGEVTLTGTQTLTNKTLASPTFTGTANGVNLTLSGDLQVNGTTTTLDTTNLKVTDNLIELNQGVSSNANDSGIIIERGSTGDNAIIMWDESADKFTLGTTTATADATGNITITTGTLVASTFEGNLTGNVTGSASLNLLISNNLSDLANASTARTNLGVDAAGTDNSTDVTLAGSLDYITLSGQEITRNAINLTTDVTGTLPVGNGGTGLTSISTLLNSNVTPTSLGLVIGTDVQAQDTLLQDIADFSLSNPSQDGYLIAYSDAEPQLELVAPGISFNGSTANGLLTYGNSTTADVESNLTFNASTNTLAVNDLNIRDDGNNTFVENSTGSLLIRNQAHGSKLQFGTEDSSGTLAYVLNITGDNHRVGIGATSPSTKLEIKDTRPVLRITDDSSGTIDTAIGTIEFYSEDTSGNYPAVGASIKAMTESSFGSGHGLAFLTNADSASPTERMRIDEQGNVGIGTASPSGRLNVVDSDGSVLAKFQDSDSSHSGIIIAADTNGGHVGNSGGYAGEGIYFQDSIEVMRFYAAGSERMRLTGTGRLGIGTSSPTDTLQVEGSIGVGVGRDAQLTSVNNGLAIRNLVSNADMFFYVNDGGSDTEAMRIDGATANVGIGTTTPAGKLDVYPDTDNYVRFGRAYVGYVGFSDIAGFAHVDNANTTTYALLQNGSGQTWLNAKSGNKINFRIGNDTDNAMTIASDKNVGIGTNSPQRKLHVSTGNTDIAARFENTTSNGSVAEFISSGDSRTLTIQTDHIYSNGSLFFGLGNYTNTYRAGTHIFQEDTGNTEVMRITGQNVGIGTNSPSVELHVKDASSHAQLRIETDSASHGAYLELEGSANKYQIYNVGGDLGIDEAGVATRLTIKDSTGSVLIGTTNTGWDGDADNLVVGSGSGNNGMTIYAGSSNFSQINFADSNSGAGRYTGLIRYLHSIDAMSFYTNGGTEALRIDSSQDAHFDQDVIAFSTTPSDKRLKTNIKDIDYGLNTIMKLNPKQYDWKKDNRHDIGFIAQEVEEVIPEIVKDKKHFDKEIKTLDYEKLTAVLIKAVQEQQEQINKLERKLNG